MADLSFYGGLYVQGSGGVSDYDDLKNVPVVRVSGSPVIIGDLASGVYSIDGTWSIVTGDEVRHTGDDDLFYVANSEAGCVLTWVSAYGLRTYRLSAGGSASDIEEIIGVTQEQIEAAVLQAISTQLGIHYDDESRTMQLTGGGEPIGSAVTVPSDDYADDIAERVGDIWTDMTDEDADGSGEAEWDSM